MWSCLQHQIEFHSLRLRNQHDAPKKMYSEVSSEVKNHPSMECQLQKEQEHGRKRKENRLQRSMCWLRHATGSACFDRDDQQIGLKCLITAHRDIIISTACQRCFLFSSVPHGFKMLSHLLICKHYGLKKINIITGRLSVFISSNITLG